MAEKHERVELEKTLNPANIWQLPLALLSVGVLLFSPLTGW